MKNVLTITSNDFFININYFNYLFKNIQFDELEKLEVFEILNFDMILFYIEDTNTLENKNLYLEEVFNCILDIKKNKYTSQLPTLIIHNENDKIPFKKFYKSGINDIVSNFIDKEVLFLKINNFINLYKSLKISNKNEYNSNLNSFNFNKNVIHKNTFVNKKRNIKDKKYKGYMIAEFDNFNGIRQIYGENVKEEVIEYISNIILNSFRDEDIVITWNHHQFLIISPIHNQDELIMLSKRIIKNILLIDLMSLFNIDKRISISVGLAIKDLDDKNNNNNFKYYIELAQENLKIAQKKGQRQYFIEEDI